MNIGKLELLEMLTRGRNPPAMDPIDNEIFVCDVEKGDKVQTVMFTGKQLLSALKNGDDDWSEEK